MKCLSMLQETLVAGVRQLVCLPCGPLSAAGSRWAASGTAAAHHILHYRLSVAAGTGGVCNTSLEVRRERLSVGSGSREVLQGAAVTGFAAAFAFSPCFLCSTCCRYHACVHHQHLAGQPGTCLVSASSRLSLSIPSVAGAMSVYTTKSLLASLGVSNRRSGEAAAAINWVLKDGAGRLGRFLFARW